MHREVCDEIVLVISVRAIRDETSGAVEDFRHFSLFSFHFLSRLAFFIDLY